MKATQTMISITGGLLMLSATAKTLYVAPEGNDANDGTSWAQALKSPEAAAEKLRDDDGNTLNFSTIIISNGIYKLTAPLEFSVRKKPAKQDLAHVTVRSFTSNPADVVLDGQGACRGINFATGYANSIVGLTISNCCVTAQSGAGIYCYGSNSEIRNCIVRDCHNVAKGAAADGGGIYSMYGTVADTLVENCSCVQDPTDSARAMRGGGIYLYRAFATNCIVRYCKAEGSLSGNTDVYGGGIHWGDDKTSTYAGQAVMDCVIEHCRCVSPAIPKASANSVGNGALSVWWPADAAHGLAPVRNCRVAYCEVSGAPVWLDGADMRDCTVTCNTNVSEDATNPCRSIGVWVRGGSHVDGCLLTGNSGKGSRKYGDTGASGTPVFRLRDANGLVANCLVSNNFAGAHVCLNFIGATGAVVSNCVFDSNTQLEDTCGGLIYCDNLSAGTTDEIVDCTFVNNDASVCTWGAFSFFGVTSTKEATLRFRNCRITGNRLGKNSLSMYAYSSAKNYSAQRMEIENCTIVSNRLVGGTVVHGYYEKEWSHCAPSNIFVKGSAVLWNEGAQYQVSPLLRRDTDHMTYSLSTEAATYSGDLGNLVYDPTKPLFKDILNADFRPAADSQLCDRVPYSSWMGEDNRRSPTRDLGSGYAVERAGTHGVSIVRKDSVQRISGTFADIGCCERRIRQGLILICR